MAHSFDPHAAGAASAPAGATRAGSREWLAWAWDASVRVVRGIRWYVANLMGDSAYATYVAHQRRRHPDAPVPTEREFWRQRMADQDRNPGARCC